MTDGAQTSKFILPFVSVSCRLLTHYTLLKTFANSGLCMTDGINQKCAPHTPSCASVEFHIERGHIPLMTESVPQHSTRPIHLSASDDARQVIPGGHSRMPPHIFVLQVTDAGEARNQPRGSSQVENNILAERSGRISCLKRCSLRLCHQSYATLTTSTMTKSDNVGDICLMFSGHDQHNYELSAHVPDESEFEIGIIRRGGPFEDGTDGYGGWMIDSDVTDHPACSHSQMSQDQPSVYARMLAPCPFLQHFLLWRSIRCDEPEYHRPWLSYDEQHKSGMHSPYKVFLSKHSQRESVAFLQTRPQSYAFQRHVSPNGAVLDDIYVSN